MRGLTRTTFVALGIAVATLATSNTGHATMINGSLPVAGFTVSANNPDLGSATIITSGLTVTSGPGTFDYSFISTGTPGSGTVLDLSNLTAFTLGVGPGSSIGTFTTSSGFVATHTANFLNVYLLGTFTPGAGFIPPGFDPTATSLSISVTQSTPGGTIAEAITLNSPPAAPPAAVPEPATWASALLGLAGAAAFRRLRRKQTA